MGAGTIVQEQARPATARNVGKKNQLIRTTSAAALRTHVAVKGISFAASYSDPLPRDQPQGEQPRMV
jgi:hypothetical protein